MATKFKSNYTAQQLERMFDRIQTFLDEEGVINSIDLEGYEVRGEDIEYDENALGVGVSGYILKADSPTLKLYYYLKETIQTAAQDVDVYRLVGLKGYGLIDNQFEDDQDIILTAEISGRIINDKWYWRFQCVDGSVIIFQIFGWQDSGLDSSDMGPVFHYIREGYAL